MTDPLYYAEGLTVRKRSVETKRDDGYSSFTLGFPVCVAHEAIGEEGAEAIAAMLNAADTPSTALVEEMAEALAPFVNTYKEHDDPGVSDLYNEQPVAWHVPLGAYRHARAALVRYRKEQEES